MRSRLELRHSVINYPVIPFRTALPNWLQKIATQPSTGSLGQQNLSQLKVMADDAMDLTEPSDPEEQLEAVEEELQEVRAGTITFRTPLATGCPPQALHAVRSMPK